MARPMWAPAPVDAHAEGGMPVRPAVEVHLVGMVELGGVAVGRRPGQQDAVALFMGQPWKSTSWVTVRASAWVGEKTRRNSSTARSSSSGFSASRARCSGCWKRWTRVCETSEAVVPTPPGDEQLDDRVHASSVIGCPSTSASRRIETTSSRGRRRRVAIASVMVCSIQGMSTSTAWACSGLPTRWARTECRSASTAASRRRRGRASRSSPAGTPMTEARSQVPSSMTSSTNAVVQRSIIGSIRSTAAGDVSGLITLR